MFYSFGNFCWLNSFFREREEDGEDDVILDKTSKNVQSTSGKSIKASDAKKKAGCPAKPKNEAIRS